MNTVLSNRPVLTAQAEEALEARFGLRVTARLHAGSDALPHDVTERLRIARQQALAVAASPEVVARRAAATSAYVLSSSSSASGAISLGLMGGPSAPWWNWLGKMLPVLLLLLGLFGIDQWQQLEQIGAAADIDVALLGDALPPSAFTDPGFAEFLLEPVAETAPE